MWVREPEKAGLRVSSPGFIRDLEGAVGRRAQFINNPFSNTRKEAKWPY